MKTKGKIESGRNVRVFWDKIEADNSMTLEQGEGRILQAESPLANGTVQLAENCTRVESVTLCKAESDNIVTGTEGGGGGSQTKSEIT